MTTTHTNLALVEGQVHVIKNMTNEELLGIEHPTFTISEESFMFDKGDLRPTIIASTLKLPNVPQLDRKHFVNPKVDVEELAEGILLNKYWREKPTSKQKLSEFNIDKRIFAAGYNAKEAEFTRGHMFDLFCRMQMGRIKTSDDWERYMNEIQPLSIPASVTLNENNEVIKVEW